MTRLGADAFGEMVSTHLQASGVVSDEDLRWLYPGRPDEDVAREWLATGPAMSTSSIGRDGR